MHASREGGGREEMKARAMMREKGKMLSVKS